MTDSTETQETDLFGAPITQIKERWGRKTYKKTKENQELVALLSARGWSQKRICDHMGCDEKTLRKHFSRELQAGSDMIEAECLQVLLTQMRQGKNPALNRLLDVIDLGRAAPPKPEISKADDGKEKLGKKEKLNLAAAAPSEGWSNILQ